MWWRSWDSVKSPNKRDSSGVVGSLETWGELTLLVAQNCLCPSLISGLNFCSSAFCTLQMGGGSRPVCRASCAQTNTQVSFCNSAATEEITFQLILLIEKDDSGLKLLTIMYLFLAYLTPTYQPNDFVKIIYSVCCFSTSIFGLTKYFVIVNNTHTHTHIQIPIGNYRLFTPMDDVPHRSSRAVF